MNRRVASRAPALLFACAVAVASAAGGCTGCDAPPTDPPPVEEHPAGKNVVVQGAAVRACTAVFAAAGDEVPGVVFADGVDGEFVPRAPRFALSFAAAADASLDGQEVARFAFTKNDAPSPTLVEARCFDGAGAAVTAGLTVVE